jgi:hypothetical protein
MIEMKKLSNSQKLEMLIGKGVLFIIEVIIALGLFWLVCFCLNVLVQTMLHNFWLTMTFVILDFVLIYRELKKI